MQTSVSKKNSPNKKGYVGFVGSQPTLLLLHTIFRQASKSNNVGCDPINPTYPFLFGEFFTNTCSNKKKQFSVDDTKSVKRYQFDFGTIMLEIMLTSALSYSTFVKV